MSTRKALSAAVALSAALTLTLTAIPASATTPPTTTVATAVAALKTAETNLVSVLGSYAPTPAWTARYNAAEAAVKTAQTALTTALATPPPPPAGGRPLLQTSYTGSARNLTGLQSGAITLNKVTQIGGAVAGTFAFKSPLTGTGPFTGTITNSSVTFTVKPTPGSCPGCTSIVFTGWVSPLVSMTGTWVAHLASGSSQNGTWSVGSSWTGNGHNTQQDGTAPLVLNLTESESGMVTGTAVWRADCCQTSVSGTLTGSVIKFATPSVISYAGKISSVTLGEMSGTYIWGGDTGTWQVHRNGAQSAV